MSAARVVVAGAVNVDFVAAVAALPGPGETVMGPRVERFGGGKGANAAVAAARLGARVALVGAVGDDALGQDARAELERDGVDVAAVAVASGEPTGAALIVVDEGGENLIAVGGGANLALDPAHVERAVRDAAAPGACVLVSAEVPDAAVAAALRAAAAAGVVRVLNPAPARPGLLELAAGTGALLTPNAGEARALTGEEAPEDAAGALAARTGAPVVITLGGDGALVLAGEGAAPERRPAPAAEVVDTTGAGDTFNGALATRLAAGDGLDEAVAVALAAAALSVGAAGARGGMPSAEDVADARR